MPVKWNYTIPAQVGCRKELEAVVLSRGSEKKKPLRVGLDAGVPSAVSEVTYVSDRAHVDYISTPAGARRTAHAVAQGILTWLSMR